MAQQIKDIITGANPNAQAESDAQIGAFANSLATAIDAYIKTATVSVTVSTTGTASAQTGTGTGALS